MSLAFCDREAAQSSNKRGQKFTPDFYIKEEVDFLHIIDDAHGHNIPMIAFHPSEKYLASVSIDRGLKVWAISKKEKESSDMSFILMKEVYSCKLSHREAALWSCLWVPQDGTPVKTRSDIVVAQSEVLIKQYLQCKSFKTVSFYSLLDIFDSLFGPFNDFTEREGALEYDDNYDFENDTELERSDERANANNNGQQEEPVQDSMDELLQDPIEEQENRERPNREAQLLEEADTIISEPSAVLISTLLKMPKVLMSLVLI